MDTDMAQVLVQNRVSLALPVIPALVQNEGISVKKMSPNTMMIVNLISPDGRYDANFLSNYATIYIKDELGRLPGVAGITYLGQRDYSLRAWLDPDKLAALNLSATDVVTAISQQNLQVAAGQIGQQPAPKGQQFQLTINTLGRLTEPEQFGEIILKAGTDVSPAQAPGSSSSSQPGQNPQVSAQQPDGTAAPGGGHRQVARCGTRRARLAPVRPDVHAGRPAVRGGLDLPVARHQCARHRQRRVCQDAGAARPAFRMGSITRSSTIPPRSSASRSTEVFKTLRDAVILVGIVVLVFLQDWKAMILPMIDVPVSLIGTFAVMAAMGFSLNNLTLFGLVLAIGIVVDDAIVVLENIERLIATGLDARTATIKAMEEITGPILAITLVLSSVFMPCCFLGGISGQFFRQFAVTIAVSTIISAVNALTMTPSRAVLIFKTEQVGDGHELKREALPWWFIGVLGGLLTVWLWQDLVTARLGPPSDARRHGRCHGSAMAVVGDDRRGFIPGALVGGLAGWFLIRPVNAVLGWFFRGFNRLFDKLIVLYGRIVGHVLRVSVIVLLLYGGLLAFTYVQFNRTPTGFIPQQDKGYLLLNVQLPDSASVERTQTVMDRIETIAHKTPGVEHTLAVSGQSLLLNANAPNLGSMYILLKEFDQRRDPELSADAIAAELQERCQREVGEAIVSAFGAPPIDGLGTTGGFKLIIEDRGNLGLGDLQRVSDQIVARGNRTPGLQGLFSSSGPTRHGSTLRSTAPNAWPWVCRSARSSTRCRFTWALSTSTTSTNSAGRGRSTSRPTRASAKAAATSGSSRCGTTGGK